MLKKLLPLWVALFVYTGTQSQIVITAFNSPYSQDFNTLVNTGTSSVLPTGWALSESGTNANTTYTAFLTSSSSGDSYSFGSGTATDRALGGLQSGSLIPIIGARFTNNTGSTITSITINYTGEQWRLGAVGRVDRMDFQYSTSASSLTSGTWTNEDNLDFTAPVTAGTIGALDGNAPANRTVIAAYNITGLAINSGSDFWIRWIDFNASGADDALGIDDFTISVGGTVIPPCTEPTTQPTVLTLTPTPTSISGSFNAANPIADGYLTIRSLSGSLSSSPADGTTYSVGQALGGGIVVANTSATVFTDNNLAPATQYYYFVFAYNSENCSLAPNYLQLNPLQNNSTTLPLPACTTPTAPPTGLNLIPGNTTISGSFTAEPSANRYLSVISTSSSLSASPVNGTSYTTGQSLGGGTVVNFLSSGSFSATGLTMNTTYYLFVFSANAECSGEPYYHVVSLDGNITTTNNPNGIPPGYYNAASGLSCNALKTSLHNIISTNHTQLTYTPGVWNAYETTDLRRNDNNTATIVWDMYSDNPAGPEPYTYTYVTNQCGTYSTEGNCYNREHSFPSSWFGGTVYPMYSDLNHLFPSDGYVNSRRSNYPYGEVSAPTWTSMNNSKLGPCSFPGYSGTVFEPRDEFKGDFARGQLYMATRYENLIAGWVVNGTASQVLSGNSYPAYNSWYIKLLYKWHQNDPVSTKEIDRNNAVYAQQGNRNPFIDHPEYVHQVWQCTGLLPVTVTNFTAQKNNETVLLRWNATQETNFKKYDIERSSDGTGFYKIGEVAGRNLASYSFTDNNLPSTNTVYYRLKMVDIDGQFEYSKIVIERIAGHFSNALVYPNPTRENLTLKLQQPLLANSSLLIVDISGRVVHQQTLSAGQGNIELNVSGYAAGRYFIKISNNSKVINQSFVVIK